MSIKQNLFSIRSSLAKFCVVVPVVYASSVSAATVTGVVPANVMVSSDVQFTVSSVPWNTCSLNGRTFRIDSSTDAGKNMYSILLAAQLANKEVQINYTASTKPGTTQNNGCNTNTMATVNKLGIK